jgi:hypothetical protein
MKIINDYDISLTVVEKYKAENEALREMLDAERKTVKVSISIVFRSCRQSWTGWCWRSGIRGVALDREWGWLVGRAPRMLNPGAKRSTVI